MTALEFRIWRLNMRWNQHEAAKQLGLKQRIIAYYEHGERPIPKTTELACAALSLGVKAYPPSLDLYSVEPAFQ